MTMKSHLLGLLILTACQGKDEPSATEPDSPEAREACGLPPAWQGITCDDTFLEGRWEGECVGATEGGSEETLPLRASLLPMGVFLLGPAGIEDDLPLYETLDDGEWRWRAYVNAEVAIGDEEVEGILLHCTTEECTADPSDNWLNPGLYLGMDPEPIDPGPYDRDHVRFQFHGSTDIDANNVVWAEFAAVVDGRVEDPGTGDDVIRGTCQWQTTVFAYDGGRVVPETPIVRTGTAELRWTGCPVEGDADMPYPSVREACWLFDDEP